MPSPPSPAVTEAASRVKAAYRAHACEPVFSSAVFVGDTEAVDGVVHAWGSQRDIAAKRKRATLQDFFVAPPSSGGADAAVRAGFAAEQPKGSISTFSPNGRYKVTFVTKDEGDSSPKSSVEVWSKGRLLTVLDTTKQHSIVYGVGATFHGLGWHGSRLVYCAEGAAPADKTWWEDEGKDRTPGGDGGPRESGPMGNKFLWKESWGEAHTEAIVPQLFLLDLSRPEAATVQRLLADEPLVAGMSLGQASFAAVASGTVGASEDAAGIMFVGWPSEGRRLGLKYYTARPSAVFFYHLASSTCVQLSNPELACRSPRGSPDGQRLVYLASSSSGPHQGGSQLFSVDTSTLAFLQDPAAATTVAIDKADTHQVPGIFCYGLPSECFVSTARNDLILMDTPQRSFRVPMLADLTAGKMYPMAGRLGEVGGTLSVDEGEGLYGEETSAARIELATEAWQVLFARANTVLLQHERPNKPPSLVLGRVSGDGRTVHLTPLTASDAVAGLTAEVVSYPREPVPFEAIVLQDSLSTEPAKERPLMVIPHGGPHSVILTTFFHVHAAFVRLGYTVVLVNYRGSNAFGEAGIHALLGHIGDMDVKDVNHAASDVLERGLADPAKVCVYGGSHGGFLTAHLTAQFPERYRAASMRNPVIDMTSMVGVTDIPDWTFNECGLAFDQRARQFNLTKDDLATMHAASPISRAQSVVAPTLVLIGAKDLRVPPSQGLIWHNMLRERGVETQVRWYASDNHPLVGVECEADTFVSVCLWMQKHLQL